jgi:hypothetical protein
MSGHPGGKPTSPGAGDGAPGIWISPGSEDVGGGPLGQGAPGLLISPAYAGTLRAKPRIAAEQMAFTDFIVVSYQVFRVGKGAVDHEAESQLQGLLTRRIIAACYRSCKVSCSK